eukprot:SAG31_NODE_14642_length_795_cov_1.041667_1_plen_240_part_01
MSCESSVLANSAQQRTFLPLHASACLSTPRSPAVCFFLYGAFLPFGLLPHRFGGDFPEDDPEFEYIANRHQARHVYVLDVPSRCWERVNTCASFATTMQDQDNHCPSWRSLHVGIACQPDADTASEALLVLGGSDEHVQPFSSGDPADFRPYMLDLRSFTWRSNVQHQNTEEYFSPMPRMRFAAQAYGRHVILYSGHSQGPIPSAERVLRLDITTLEWSRVSVRNRPVSLPDTPAACLAG